MTKKSVLYLDPSDEWARIVRNRLNGEIEFVWAPSVTMAREAILNRRAFNLVVIGAVDGPETTEFIHQLRRQHTIPLLAATSDMAVNRSLLSVGCTLAADKLSVGSLIRRLLSPS